jgi:hypothetical protein
MEIGHLEGLAIRVTRHSPPRAVDCADAVAQRGLLGDAHADRLSPRQLLLASKSAYRDFALAPHALRENLLVDFETSELVSGSVLQVGSEVLLRMMFQCEACGNLDAFRPGLSRDIDTRRGMLARVIAGGTLRPGDRVVDLGPLLPAWPDDWHARVAMVLDAVPPGAVIEYRDLARLAGVQSTYCRAFPRLICSLGPEYADKAVSMHAPVTAPRWKGEGLFDHGPVLRLVWIPQG